MGLKASEAPQIDPVPVGMHLAVCSGYYDLGTQIGPKYKGKPGEMESKRKILIVWDLPEERIGINGEDLPRQISKRFTLSLGENAKLRKYLDSWRGRKFTPEELAGFDLDNIVGVACQVNVVHETGRENGRKFASVDTVTPLMKGMVRPALDRDPVRYQIKDEVTGEFVVPPEGTPHWIAKIIAQSEEGKAAGWTPPEKGERGDVPKAAPAAPSAPAEDDTPF